MTATLPMHQSKDRVMIWAVVLSLVVHAVVLAPWLRKLADSVDLSLPQETFVEPMEFTLVSPPPDPSANPEVSKYLSTRSAMVRQERATDADTDTPLSEGLIPIPDHSSPQPGVEGGGASDIPPVPIESGDLTDAFEKSRFVRMESPQRQETAPQESPDFRGEGSARASIGGIQLNTTEWDFAPYLLDLKHRIKNHWVPPLAFTALGAIHGYTWVRFRIYPDGRMEGMEVVETEGHDSLHRSSTNAVLGGAPFRKLPAGFPEEYLEITFGFYYLLPGDEKRFFKDRERGGE